MRFSPALALYRAAWEPALLLLRTLAVFERLAGKNALPIRWRPGERLVLPRLAPGPRIWLHAASLGECKGLWAFARSLSELPCGFILTANTVEARDFLARRAAATEDPQRWAIALAPPDHPRAVRRFLAACDAQALVLFEVELWPHFVRETRRAGHPVFWVSARLTRRAEKRYGLIPSALRTVLRDIAWTQAHSEGEAETLRRLGCEHVEAGGDLRGLLYLDAEGAEDAENVSGSGATRAGLAFVSFHADELEALKRLLRGLKGPAYVLPRKAEEFARFREALAPLGFESASSGARANPRANPPPERLIVDAFGRTREFLARSRGAVVGGSFADHGGHNLWEPLAAGLPAAIGPWHESQAYLAARLEMSGLLQIVHEIPEGGAESLFASATAPEALEIRAKSERTALAAELRAAVGAAREAIKRRVSFVPAR